MRNFWKNKKVLITGASGFIGSNLTLRLLELNAQIYILIDKEIKFPSLLSQKKIISRIKKIYIQNIINSEFITNIFDKEQFNFCFHYAAQPLLENANYNPALTFEINIKGTLNILEATRKSKIDGLIIASTTHIYGKNKLPFLEKYPVKPSGPYETSKACVDIISQTYASQYKLPIAIARFVNLYGPGDKNGRIVPTTIRSLLEKKRPLIFFDKTTRDYMFIEDAVNANILLAEKMEELKKTGTETIFNFGTGQHFNNEIIIKKIIKLYGDSQIKPIIIGKKREQEVNKQYVSVNKAKKYLGWQANFSLEEGLKKTIDWYKLNYLYGH